MEKIFYEGLALLKNNKNILRLRSYDNVEFIYDVIHYMVVNNAEVYDFEEQKFKFEELDRVIQKIDPQMTGLEILRSSYGVDNRRSTLLSEEYLVMEYKNNPSEFSIIGLAIAYDRGIQLNLKEKDINICKLILSMIKRHNGKFIEKLMDNNYLLF